MAPRDGEGVAPGMGRSDKHTNTNQGHKRPQCPYLVCIKALVFCVYFYLLNDSTQQDRLLYSRGRGKNTDDDDDDADDE